VSLDVTIATNLGAVRDRIAQAARRSGREAGDIRLVAVSKTFGPEHVRAAAAAGQRDFGENKVQEALQKMGALADVEIGWHLIGHLQANKARKAASAFAWIQSVDSADLLGRIDRAAAEAGAAPDLLVQVDLAGEATKHGAPPEEVRTILEAAAACRAARVRGLMLLPPWSEDADATRPYFERLRRLRDDLVKETGRPDWLGELSMGMSHDFEVAIGEGATIVRVGTAIFGRRVPRT
jgi:pyridoxal phosphate enzyme (YggS family)